MGSGRQMNERAAAGLFRKRLDEIAAAQAWLEADRHVGKIVLRL